MFHLGKLSWSISLVLNKVYTQVFLAREFTRAFSNPQKFCAVSRESRKFLLLLQQRITVSLTTSVRRCNSTRDSDITEVHILTRPTPSLFVASIGDAAASLQHPFEPAPSIHADRMAIMHLLAMHQ